MNWQDRQLHWVNDGSLTLLAPWATYFLELGHRLGGLSSGSGRTVLGFVLPVIDHAAVLAALGFACRSVKDPVAHEPNFERFARLVELPVGHAMRVLRNGRLFNGHIGDLPGERTPASIPIKVSTTAHGHGHFICTPGNCMRVEPTDMASEADHEQRGLRIVDNPAFVSAIMGNLPLENLCLGTRLDFVLVGAQGRLLAESSAGLSLGLSGPKAGLVGTPADMLRLRRGARDYRGILVPATTAQPNLPDKPPRIAIFSGAAGFLRLRDHFPSSHHLVLLDRSEPRCLEAVNQLNRQFLQRTGDGDTLLASGSPPGIEHIVFNET